MISLNFVEKPFVFHCAILVANVADSYEITLFVRPHCCPRGVSRGVPKKAFEQPKIACRASGAALGSQAPSWRPILDLLGCTSGLGGSLGYFLVAFGVSLVFFSNLHGLIFCKSLGITFVLHANVNSNHFSFAFPIFIF